MFTLEINTPNNTFVVNANTLDACRQQVFETKKNTWVNHYTIFASCGELVETANFYGVN